MNLLLTLHIRISSLPLNESGKEFEEKYKISLNLASQFSSNVRLFMETKQNAEITKSLYASAKLVD